MTYPESLKSLLFGAFFTLLLEWYLGQFMIIALKLCLQLFLHLRQRSLWERLPVSVFRKNVHSCFAFFDNFGIVKTPFTHLHKGVHFRHPFLRNLQKIPFTYLDLASHFDTLFLKNSFHLYEQRNKNIRVFQKISLHLFEMRARFLRVFFEIF